MVTESASTVVPPEIFDNIGKINTEVERLQNELSQALEVWQSTLSAEKTRFDGLLEHKELAWREQDEQWTRQTHTYEERLDNLKTEFESRLKQSEQNAAHALAELDDAWQRDKLEWGPAAHAEWPVQKKEFEAKVSALESELTDQKRLLAEQRDHYEAQLLEMERKSKIGAGPTPSTVKALQSQLLDFQQTVGSFQDRVAHSDELVGACVQALDYQIAVLYDLVHHYVTPEPSDGSSPDLVQA